MVDDLSTAARLIRSGTRTAGAAIEHSLARAGSPDCAAAFLSIDAEAARAAAATADRRVGAGEDAGLLAGLAVSVKDLFDVAGQVTRAGSSLLDGAAAAGIDAPAVARLRAAGAALIGRTNMSEFAFSGVGINPHFGTPANPAAAAIDPTPRIPGGSTSGGATSVAAGAAWAALGTDTGGSLRIPAALQGLVGYKPTARTVPTEGAFPLSTTLDSIGAITRSVRDAALLHGIVAGGAATPPSEAPPLSALRLAVPRTLMLDGLDAAVARAFDAALAALSRQGAQIASIDLPLLDELASLNAGGGFSAAESWALHRHRLASSEAGFDPRVAARIRRGAAMSAADYIDLLAARRTWQSRLHDALAGVDAVLAPTVPIVAPPVAPLLRDDAAFFAVNAQLLRNTSAINFADGCALSLPCQAVGELPVGVMVWSVAMQDAAVLAAGLAIETALGHRGRPLADRA